MNRPRNLSFRAIVVLIACAASIHPQAAADQAGLRTPWKTSQFQGTPEPPLPYRTQRVYRHVRFERPTVVTSAPGTDRLFVAEHDGKLYSIAPDRSTKERDVFLDVHDLVKAMNRQQPESPVALVAVYGLTFHPNFAENRFCYVCYVVRHQDRARGQHPSGTRVVRLTVSDTDPPRCDVASEQLVIDWLQGGHNGGCLKFGPDGCLYISTGDGGFAYPPDGRNAGQDLSNLLSAILRIDVDSPSAGRPYAIPADNPFVELPDARGEIWAYGLRNPWKMSFDRETGELWVGDVGWELWELIYRVRRGDNFGWSLVEGPQPVHTERQRGPTPIVPPIVAIPHTDGASVTGGFVYRGKRFPELVGTYLYGDWETRRIWGVNADAEPGAELKELVEPAVRIVGFAEQHDGELLLVDYDDGTLHELIRNEASGQQGKFPRRLSESGLFDSVSDHRFAPGVLPFDILAEQWSDGAVSERFIGVPGNASIKLYPSAQAIEGSMFRRMLDFPDGTVLGKTLTLEQRRIETQILHFDGRFWRGYSYAWNDQQTDAVLVDAPGQALDLGTTRWQFASRTQCIRCHNPWAEHALAFNISQINRPSDRGVGLENKRDSGSENQITYFRRIGLIEDVVLPADPEDPFSSEQRPAAAELLPWLTDPRDSQAPLDARARSYLHANCSHCHRDGGGGSAYAHLSYNLTLAQMKAIGVRPTQGTFGIHDAKILAPGDPFRSLIYYRMAKIGAGRMPHIGSHVVDEQAVDLMHDWIRQLPVRLDEAALIDQLIALEESQATEREKVDREKTLWQLSRQIADRNGRDQPNDTDRQEAEKRAAAQSIARAKERARQRAELIGQLLSSPSRALQLAAAIRSGRFSEADQRRIIESAAQHDSPPIRDLFEAFVPYSQRTARLGDAVNMTEILKLPGDIASGRRLFHKTEGVQCRNCHRIGDDGKQLGPDLTAIGKKFDRRQLLESILQPSQTIDPKFATWLVETTDGRVLSGLLLEKSASATKLIDARGETVVIAADEIETAAAQRKSMMPDLLLRDMTAQQVADLLAYLASLK